MDFLTVILEQPGVAAILALGGAFVAIVALKTQPRLLSRMLGSVDKVNDNQADVAKAALKANADIAAKVIERDDCDDPTGEIVNAMAKITVVGMASLQKAIEAQTEVLKANGDVTSQVLDRLVEQSNENLRWFNHLDAKLTHPATPNKGKNGLHIAGGKSHHGGTG